MKIVLHTSGRGLWSDEKTEVRIVNIKLGYVEEVEEGDGLPEYGEIKVFFDTKTWSVRRNGLIYTDPRFLRELRTFLKKHGLPGSDVDYTEQGMQTRRYVSCGCGKKFMRAWHRKFGVIRDDRGHIHAR